MRAVCWEGTGKIQVETVPDPVILDPRDAIIKITTTAICGSDLHIYDGYVPTMQRSDVLGHEFMGEVVDVGKENTRAESWRSCRGAAHDRARALLFLQRAALLAVRQLQPECLDGGKALRVFGVRPLWLLAHVWRIPRRSGGICASPVCRRRPAEGAGQLDR